MPHTVNAKKPLLARVRRIKGQLEALERALTREDECTAVLQQTAAIRGAVSSLMVAVVEGHLRNHLASERTSPKERRQGLDAVVQIVRSYLK
jgi:DNA-binding FrmR family transcriptional regulator